MDYDDILVRYTRLRAVNFELNKTLTNLLSKETIEHAARQLGIWADGRIVFDDMDRVAVLMDYALHDCRVNGRTAVERYVAEHAAVAKSEEEIIFGGLQRGFYSLFQVEEVVPGAGVQVHDVLRDQRHFLADVGFSQTAVKGAVVATRVFPFGDFVMTGGAALAVDADTMEAIGRLPELPRRHCEISDLAPEASAELSAAIIRLCMGASNTARIMYQRIGGNEEEEVLDAVRPARRTGRNEPCPCGSGKKYKKCCGR